MQQIATVIGSVIAVEQTAIPRIDIQEHPAVLPSAPDLTATITLDEAIRRYGLDRPLCEMPWEEIERLGKKR